MTPTALSTVDDATLATVLDRVAAPPWRATQLRDATWQPYIAGFAGIRNLPASLRDELSRHLDFSTVSVSALRQTDAGLTLKLLCALGDGATVEAVAMETPARGAARRRSTVCVSTQVG